MADGDILYYETEAQLREMTIDMLAQKVLSLREENKALRNDLHDRYVMTAMPASIGFMERAVASDNAFAKEMWNNPDECLRKMVKFARKVADEAMRQRGGK